MTNNRPPRGPNRPPFKKKREHNINEDIRHENVRLIGDNVTPGLYEITKAREIAKEQGLDLVEIPNKSDPPICKVVEYGKFLYDIKKTEKDRKKKQTKSELKELRFGQNIDEHDYEFKKRYAEKFLKDGDKVKAYVQFKGRSITFKEQGELVLLRLASDLADIGKPESLPILDGKKMIIIISPKKK